VYAAGGFGLYPDIRNCEIPGLLSGLPEGGFRFTGNLTLTGSYMVLLSADHRIIRGNRHST